MKDILELFMDTGIGKEGYSIIGQGRIDELLSMKGEERRKVFEEAAGIVKYKSRRTESERKLRKDPGQYRAGGGYPRGDRESDRAIGAAELCG